MTYTPNDVMPHSHIQVHTHTSTHSESGALGSNVSGYFLKVLQVLVLYLDPATYTVNESVSDSIAMATKCDYSILFDVFVDFRELLALAESDPPSPSSSVNSSDMSTYSIPCFLLYLERVAVKLTGNDSRESLKFIQMCVTKSRPSQHSLKVEVLPSQLSPDPMAAVGTYLHKQHTHHASADHPQHQSTPPP